MKKKFLCYLLFSLMSVSAWASVDTFGWEYSWYSDFIRIHFTTDEPYVIVSWTAVDGWQVIDGPFDVPKKTTITTTYTLWQEPVGPIDPWVIAWPAKHVKFDDNGKHVGWFKEPK